MRAAWRLSVAGGAAAHPDAHLGEEEADERQPREPALPRRADAVGDVVLTQHHVGQPQGQAVEQDDAFAEALMAEHLGKIAEERRQAQVGQCV